APAATCPSRMPMCIKLESSNNEWLADRDRRAIFLLNLLTYSHSIVPGGFEVMSYTTRLMPRTSLVIRDETRASRSCESRAQSAVMPSDDVTARRATVFSYVRKSPITPTDWIGKSTANACQTSL